MNLTVYAVEWYRMDTCKPGSTKVDELYLHFDTATRRVAELNKEQEDDDYSVDRWRVVPMEVL